MSIKITKGPAAANIYKIIDNNTITSQLLLDWSFDAIDFKYFNNSWITLDIFNIKELDSEQFNDFKDLANHALIELKDYSEKTNNSLLQITDLMKARV